MELAGEVALIMAGAGGAGGVAGALVGGKKHRVLGGLLGAVAGVGTYIAVAHLATKPAQPAALGCPPLTEAELEEARAKGILPLV